MNMEKSKFITEIFSENHPKYTIESNEVASLIQSEAVNHIRILDCSWYLPFEKKNPREMFMKDRIPFAQFFDIDEVADRSIDQPHMMPSEETFTYFMKEMDIRKSDHIICYDMVGMFTAPRAWFTFKVYGFDNVFVLNGGFPKWVKEALPVEKGDDFTVKNLKREKPLDSDFDYKPDKSKVINMDQVLELSLKKQRKLVDEYIIDCRSAPRFRAEVEEPRPTLRIGHIEEADNVFFKDLLDQNWCFKSESEIKAEHVNRNINIDRIMTFYCGTGATACVNILALALLGKFDNCKLYDGSWSEMGNVFDEVIQDRINKLKNEIM